VATDRRRPPLRVARFVGRGEDAADQMVAALRERGLDRDALVTPTTPPAENENAHQARAGVSGIGGSVATSLTGTQLQNRLRSP
jgi:methylmalonyl-CoA mutase cobalamin-binding subunit